jgi:hypothetical protein
LKGRGTIITPDATKSRDGLDVVRGTFLTYGDEQRSLTIEGLTINARDNVNAGVGFNIQDTHVYLHGNTVYASDDGAGPHNTGFMCFYWAQISATNPNTGPFYGKMMENDCQGNGVGVSGVPVCIYLSGSVNAMSITNNHCAQGTYAMRIANPCSTVNANCAYLANGTLISGNNFENFTECIEIHAFVPTLAMIVGTMITGNTFEACSSVVLDIATITQQSGAGYELTFWPNTLIGPIGTNVSNPNSITIKNY